MRFAAYQIRELMNSELVNLWFRFFDATSKLISLKKATWKADLEGDYYVPKTGLFVSLNRKLIN